MRNEQNEARATRMDLAVEIGRLTVIIDRHEQKIADAYIAIAYLADRCGLFDHPQVQAALDCFADPAAPQGDWRLDELALAPGTEWQGEPAEHPAPVDVMAYWG